MQAARKTISLGGLRKLPSPMHLIRVRSSPIDCLFSGRNALGRTPV